MHGRHRRRVEPTIKIENTDEDENVSNSSADAPSSDEDTRTANARLFNREANSRMRLTKPGELDLNGYVAGQAISPKRIRPESMTGSLIH